ncbi:MAG: trehalase family glycosidase, partial [Myxococcales bacterium]
MRSHLSAALPQDEFANISLRLLPRPSTPVGKQGLLYLPRPYLASGPRFNEMNGWSSYFLIRGLLEAGEIARARDLVDDAVYEVMNFGKVLDVNRTYDLGRS